MNKMLKWVMSDMFQDRRKVNERNTNIQARNRAMQKLCALFDMEYKPMELEK